MAARVRADLILRALQKATPRNEKFFAEVKTGSTYGDHVRLDAIWLRCSWTRPRITGFEIKVSRSDFLSDDKWPAYKAVCHRFYFVCPEGLIRPEELDPEVGMYWYSPDKDTLRCKKAAPHRDVPLDVGILYYLVQWRVEPHRHPFFSDKREYLQAWVHDKEERRILGHMVGTKMAKELVEAQKRVAELERRVEALRKSAQDAERLREIARRSLGVFVWGDDWVERFQEAIANGAGSMQRNRIIAIANSLRHRAQELEELVGRLERTEATA